MKRNTKIKYKKILRVPMQTGEVSIGNILQRNLNMKKILLEKLLEKCGEQTYQKQYEYIMNLLEEQKIKPVKASRLNGKSPALYREYWVLEEKKDYSTYIEELRYEIVPDISVDYYLRHLESYEVDRTWVLELNQYLKNKKRHFSLKYR